MAPTTTVWVVNTATVLRRARRDRGRRQRADRKHEKLSVRRRRLNGRRRQYPPPPRGDLRRAARTCRDAATVHADGQGTGSSRFVIQPMPGRRKSERRRPRRGQPEADRAEPGSENGARRAATPPPKPNFAAHQTTIVNKSIIAALYIGWFLLPLPLPGAPPPARTLSMLLVNSGRAATAHRRHFLITSTHHLSRAAGNCNRGCRRGGSGGSGAVSSSDFCHVLQSRRIDTVPWAVLMTGGSICHDARAMRKAAGTGLMPCPGVNTTLGWVYQRSGG